MYNKHTAFSEPFFGKTHDSHQYEPSFQLNVSPAHSYHQVEPHSLKSSLPCSPKHKIAFSLPRFEAGVQYIEQQLLYIRDLDDDVSSVNDTSEQEVKPKAKSQLRGEKRVKNTVIKRPSIITPRQEMEDFYASRSPEGKEGPKTGVERQVGKVKIFWKGTSLQYPFTFKKVYVDGEQEEKVNSMRVCEEDYSKKIISFADYGNGSG